MLKAGDSQASSPRTRSARLRAIRRQRPDRSLPAALADGDAQGDGATRSRNAYRSLPLGPVRQTTLAAPAADTARFTAPINRMPTKLTPVTIVRPARVRITTHN